MERFHQSLEIWNNKTGELICHDCSSRGKHFINKDGLIFLQKIENMHLDDIDLEMNNSSEMFIALRFLEIFNRIHLEGMNKVHSLDMVQKLLKL